MKVIAVTTQWKHHNLPSSPDYIINYINYAKVIKLNEAYTPLQELGKLKKEFNKLFLKVSGMGGYGNHYFLKEMKTVRKTFLRKYLVHFFAGENSYKFFPFFNLRNKVVATFHQPPELFHRFVRRNKDSHFKKLDGIILTTRKSIDFFKNYIDESRIFFLPLPIDTNTFKPVKKDKNEKKVCLFLGTWLRDFKTMNEVIKLLRDKKEIEFQLVTWEQNRKFFDPSLNNMKFFVDISFAEYINKLQRADALVLPLQTATSNLTILEAMSVGLPIITTDVGGVRDYINDSFAILKKKGDAKGIAEAVVDLLSNESLRKEFGKKARKHAIDNFDFSVVSEKLKDIYRKLGVTQL